MTPGRYTELFFHDEATALAAGHRPCGECRNADYRRFRAAWIAGNADAASDEKPAIKAIDQRLHAERLREDGSKRTFSEACGNLPDGVFVTLPVTSDAFLLWNRQLLRWTPGGYSDRLPAEANALVDVLTPRSTVRALAAGFLPVVHPTADTSVKPR